jgi:hypothetical protein
MSKKQRRRPQRFKGPLTPPDYDSQIHGVNRGDLDDEDLNDRTEAAARDEPLKSNPHSQRARFASRELHDRNESDRSLDENEDSREFREAIATAAEYHDAKDRDEHSRSTKKRTPTMLSPLQSGFNTDRRRYEVPAWAGAIAGDHVEMAVLGVVDYWLGVACPDQPTRVRARGWSVDFDRHQHQW